jgi:CheY-like chemotaxis protein
MSSSKSIRVMIVDDHGMVRRGLATILKINADLELVGEASNGQEALDLCTEVRPDVILMDLVMPEMGGAEATRLIRKNCPEIQVIALTSFQETELVRDALRAGAVGYRSTARGLRPHTSRAGSTGPHGGGVEQSRDRRAAGYKPVDRQGARQQYPIEARRLQPSRGGRSGAQT